MKKNLIVFVIALFVSLTGSFAQSGSLGLCLGPTFSKPVVKNTLEPYRYSNYSDGTISIVGQYNLKAHWSLLWDLGVCNRGMAVKQPVTLTSYDPVDGSMTYRDETNKYRYSFSYLDNSFLARYTIGNKIKFYANAGFYYSLLLRTKKLIVDEYYDTYGVTGTSQVHSQYANNSNYAYRKSDLGFAVGLGLQKGRFGLDYRYYLGLSEVSKYPETISLHSSFSTLKLSFVFLQLQKEQLPHVRPHKKKAR